ncbi:type 4 prepilin-like proteins leader peptide-processing enzyme [Aliidongia dinghuensis]|uniref:Prepilin leader peptidase/N-methyltransferase n=1 Tax=Aliidongia dinghuensis TaxID=1867774 RepID=A0A8J2YUG5_9PROT|nr:A24 family peptidase [Aliidongia dinghuensis]GGF23660.1 type 4 prepilin-like proteins leader peptide-processing enzyme [Aliidongia dinghuensis]
MTVPPAEDALVPDWLAYVLAPFIGSFMGVLIRRLPADLPIGNARSRCDHCGTRLGVRDLVPLLSWLANRGRCRHCGKPIGEFYPLVELAALGVALWAGTIDVGAALWLDCLLGWTLVTLAWIDAEHLLLPDVLTLPLILAGLGAAWVLEWPPIVDAAAGASVGYVVFRLVALAYRQIRGREGLGAGDAKLLAVAGAWLGWQALGDVVLGGALAGLLWYFIARPANTATENLAADAAPGPVELPFGPALAVAIWVVRLYGPFLGLF